MGKDSTTSRKSFAIKIAKVDCTFRLWCTLDTQQQQVVFLELSTHTNHLLDAPTDVVHLKPHPKVMALTKYYLALGQRPMQRVGGIDRWIDKKALASGISFLDTFKGHRYHITEQDVYKIRKMECRAKRLDLNDVIATNRLHDSLGEEVVLYKQEQLVNDAGEIIQDLIIVICTQYQREILKLYSSRLVMLDFTGGILIYGCPLGAIAIKNAMGKGEPVAFIISIGESTEVVTKCL